MRRSVVLLVLLVFLPLVASLTAYQAGVRFRFVDLRDPSPPLADEFVAPPDWREDVYLRLNPDVAAAVRRGQFVDGYAHYVAAGRNEGRPGGLPASRPQPPAPPQPQPQPQVAAAPEPAPAPTTGPAPAATPAPASPAPLPAAPPPPAAVKAPLPPPVPAARQTAPEPPPAVEPGAREYVIRNGGPLQRVAEVTGIPLERLRQLNPDLPRGWLPAGSVVALVERPVAPKPVPGGASALASLPEPAKPEPAKPAQPAGAASVERIRFGMHSGTLRVVLDASGPMQFRQSVQGDRRTVVVELPDVRWSALRDGRIDDQTVLRFYRAEPSGAGTRLVLHTNPRVAVRSAALFPPVEGRGHRVVLDIAPDGGR